MAHDFTEEINLETAGSTDQVINERLMLKKTEIEHAITLENYTSPSSFKFRLMHCQITIFEMSKHKYLYQKFKTLSALLCFLMIVLLMTGLMKLKEKNQIADKLCLGDTNNTSEILDIIQWEGKYICISKFIERVENKLQEIRDIHKILTDGQFAKERRTVELQLYVLKLAEDNGIELNKEDLLIQSSSSSITILLEKMLKPESAKQKHKPSLRKSIKNLVDTDDSTDLINFIKTHVQEGLIAPLIELFKQ